MNTGRLKKSGIAAVTAAVLFTGCGNINPNATLVTINDGEGTKDTITLGYGNFVARYQQSMYDQYLLAYYGEDMWKSDMSGTGSTLEDDTKDGVLEDLEEQYLAKKHAGDYGVELTEEQNTAIAEAAAQFIADNDEESLDVMGATEEYVKQYLEDRTYYSLVSAAAKEASDADISDEDCWMRTFTYVVFDTTGTTDENGTLVEYTEDEVKDLENQAKTLATAADFDATVEDLGVSASTYSYLKGEEEDSTMDMTIIEAAEKLSEGDVSDVIEIDGVGYYVIRLDSDHDEDASQSKRESLQTEAFNTLMDSWKEAITWTVDEKAWAKVKFDSLFKAPEVEETEETTEDTTTEETTEDTTAEEDAEETSEETTDETTEETEAE
ncbi:MAG: peptidyl-prolyl cis-trans isomerase [Pseudobutyrivibrio sp.]|nr:peptidyl-prolyl cis-trans isomerase [Pseudobutyrivibrio sp.]